jgi:hypothetical protein
MLPGNFFPEPFCTCQLLYPKHDLTFRGEDPFIELISINILFIEILYLSNSSHFSPPCLAPPKRLREGAEGG